jgi:hypothetical protein
MTANVLPASGFPGGTPRTFGCARCTGPKPTKHRFIACANAPNIAQMFENGKGRGPFILMPEGRGTLAYSW